ncbi:GGDEF domain-containing phosphodiesterase [uncultured Treponema sp.]|uniref:GGDEF domain-containing phosphodiesterase n=1 Tax=uncultured Treponema sp. TaxID=162155 RepID=UPI0025D0296F|nr:GGDEF domain-containing phosphodiesterase [uncultured Treponema sp.]
MFSIRQILKNGIHGIRNFLGLQGYSSYYKHYIDIDNARSAVIISIIVMILELYMMGYVFLHILLDSRLRTFYWIVQHLSAYVILFTGGLVLFLFSNNFLKGKTQNRVMGKVIMILFALLCLAFGSYISFLDYIKGEHILTFVAMEILIMGLMIWRPAVSIPLITGSFLFFFYLCNARVPASYATKVNLFIVWLAIVITTTSRFHQKTLEAKKAEHIENVNAYLGDAAATDEATGIGNMLSFRNRVAEIRNTDKEEFLSRIFLFLDVTNFKSYNERHGFDEGTSFLGRLAHTIQYTFIEDIVARFSDDHFVIFAKRDGFEEKIDSVRKKVIAADNEVKLGLKVGSYIPEDVTCHTNTACDFARHACESIIKKYDVDYCEYTTASAEDFARKQYIINNIDKALAEGYIQIYYQPVVFAKNRELCGFEALARWIDPKYGFMPPYTFISVLEEYRQIHKLDAYMLKMICDDIVNAPAKNVPVLSVSVNFSRLDFDLMDIEKLLEENVEKRGIDKKLIHIEVTESALAQNDTNLQDTLHRLKDKNYSLWLDDFGSGYSGLNILKEYEFDVMKIDMAFLKNFSNTPKTRPILKNIISLANDIGMHTLSEGVETEEAFEFLRSIGCERIQGYLFGRPMPKTEVMEKMRNGELLLPKKEK